MWFFLSAVQSALHLKRTCPNCGNQQAVKILEKKKTVYCRRCGHSIPPEKHKD